MKRPAAQLIVPAPAADEPEPKQTGSADRAPDLVLYASSDASRPGPRFVAPTARTTWLERWWKRLMAPTRRRR